MKSVVIKYATHMALGQNYLGQFPLGSMFSV